MGVKRYGAERSPMQTMVWCQCDINQKLINPETAGKIFHRSRYRTIPLSLKDKKIFQHSQPMSISRDIDDTMHSTVIRIYSGIPSIPFSLKYFNAFLAASRLARFLVVPSPLPMATLRTEGVVLT